MLQLVLFMCECVGGGLGVWLGLDWGLDTHSSATCCDPASLVFQRLTMLLVLSRKEIYRHLTKVIAAKLQYPMKK